VFTEKDVGDRIALLGKNGSKTVAPQGAAQAGTQLGQLRELP
jgi:hypothetical protein